MPDEPVVSLLNRELQSKLGCIDRGIAGLKKQKQTLITNAVSACKHPLASIYAYQNRENTGSRGPWLVCAACGYSEQGWGIGFNKLKHADCEAAGRSMPKITREQWLATSTVRVAQELSSGDD